MRLARVTHDLTAADGVHLGRLLGVQSVHEMFNYRPLQGFDLLIRFHVIVRNFTELSCFNPTNHNWGTRVRFSSQIPERTLPGPAVTQYPLSLL